MHMQHYSGERLALLGRMSSGPIFGDLNGPSTVLATIIHKGFFSRQLQSCKDPKGPTVVYHGITPFLPF